MTDDNILQFPLPDDAAKAMRTFPSPEALQAWIAAGMSAGDAPIIEEICRQSLAHLRERAALGYEDGVEVAASNLNIVLGYIAALEAQAGLRMPSLGDD